MRIALVDPSRTVLKYVTRLLEAREHEVGSFVDPRAALDHIASDPVVRSGPRPSATGTQAQPRPQSTPRSLV